MYNGGITGNLRRALQRRKPAGFFSREIG